MSSHKHIHDELRELNSTLPSHVKEPVFSVPEGYFENFAASVLMRLKEETAVSAADELTSLSPLLASLSKQMPYNLPQNYFSTLSDNVPALVQEDELPAFLAEHTRTNPYEVPKDYFDNLSTEVVAKVAPKQAKVVSFNRARWMRVAAAAIVAGVIAVSGLVYYNSRPVGSADPSASDSWIANQLKNVSSQDLEEFIETADITPTEQMATHKKPEVRQMLKDVSVKELDAFLSQLPADEELFN